MLEKKNNPKELRFDPFDSLTWQLCIQDAGWKTSEKDISAEFR